MDALVGVPPGKLQAYVRAVCPKQLLALSVGLIVCVPQAETNAAGFTVGGAFTVTVSARTTLPQACVWVRAMR